MFKVIIFRIFCIFLINLQFQFVSTFESSHQPWYIKILYKTNSYGRRVVCGGSLISPTWALTAASCFSDDSKRTPLRITLSAPKKKKHPYENSWTQRRLIIIHPKYNRNTPYHNDLALVKLKKDIPNAIWSPLLLPKHSLYNSNLNGSLVSVYPFGKIHKKSIQKRKNVNNHKTFKFLRFRITSNHDCISTFPVTRKSIICTKTVDGDRSVCMKNHGGGLVLTRNGHSYMLGINSLMADTLCYTRHIGFESLDNNIKWITSVTGQD